MKARRTFGQIYRCLDDLMARWSKRFLDSTRGQVVQLLRRGEASVNELAERLGLTPNAIRAHLSTLERDGLVEETGKRSSVRRPESIYAVTSDAEQLYPKAYHHLLGQLLEKLEGRLSSDEIEEILREVGRDLAKEHVAEYAAKDFRGRVDEALTALGRMGGLAEVREENGNLVIQGCSCPVGDAVSRHPKVCRLAEAMLSEIIGARVQETCDRDGTPRCSFQIERPR